MAETDARHRDPAPAHPGELLRDVVLPAIGKPKAEIARLLGISRQALHNILAERAPVTPEMAARLGKLCGNGARLWINMQAAHDLWHAERRIDVSGIPTLRVSLRGIGVGPGPLAAPLPAGRRHEQAC